MISKFLYCIFLCSAALAQPPASFKPDYLWELKQIPARQVVALAEAMPPEKFGWRP